MRVGIINPGTEPIEGAQLADAIVNMDALLADVNLDGATFERLEKRDYGDGRYCFVISYGAAKVEIQMPGMPLARVRYMRDEGQNIWHFPRLYVDGDSWVWVYAYDIARANLIADDMSEDVTNGQL